MNRLHLALVSPERKAVSETFISAHRRFIEADISHYYKGGVPRCLDGYGPLCSNALSKLLPHRVRRKMFYPGLNSEQLSFRDSLLRERVNVVLAEYGTTAAEILPVCRSLGLPLIAHFHGFDASVQSVLDRYRSTYKELFEYATRVIAVSRVMERNLLELGCPRDKLIYNVYGPADEFFAVEQEEESSSRFVGVGRFVDKKGPHYTLLAFREVLKKHPGAELVIAGEGPLWSVCRDLVRHFDMDEHVTLPGPLSPAQIRSQFSKCVAFVQHSVTAPDGDMEGTPVAVLEAGAAALPVVATRHAGIQDIVIDGNTGLLVDERDVEGMALNMCSILEKPEKSKAMGQRARNRIRESFSMKRHIHELNTCLRLSNDSCGSAIKNSDILFS